jgi:hypothetical protein
MKSEEWFKSARKTAGLYTKEPRLPFQAMPMYPPTANGFMAIQHTTIEIQEGTNDQLLNLGI